MRKRDTIPRKTSVATGVPGLSCLGDQPRDTGIGRALLESGAAYELAGRIAIEGSTDDRKPTNWESG
jgi:hypothetical protein